MELRQLIEEYLEQARMMQIATSIDNQPWACTVYFAYDEDLTLYWISQPSRRHSQELIKNSKVAGAIVSPHTPGDNVRGLQFQGTAQKLETLDELTKGVSCYTKRYSLSDERQKSLIHGTDDHACYVIKQELIVLFDEVNFPDQPRQEFKV
jgi:uncharacterized protein